MSLFANDTAEMLREMGFVVRGNKTVQPVVQIQPTESTVAEVLAEESRSPQSIIEMVPMTIDGLKISEEDILAIRTSRVTNPILRDVVDFTKKHMSEAQVSDIRNIFTPMILKMQEQMLTAPDFISLGQVILGQFVGIINAPTDEDAEFVLQSLKDYIASNVEIVEA